MKCYLTIFRNGKETSKKHRISIDFFVEGDEIHPQLKADLDKILWSVFCINHLAAGGTIKDKDSFIADAKSLGYTTQLIEE